VFCRKRFLRFAGVCCAAVIDGQNEEKEQLQDVLTGKQPKALFACQQSIPFLLGGSILAAYFSAFGE